MLQSEETLDINSEHVHFALSLLAHMQFLSKFAPTRRLLATGAAITVTAVFDFGQAFVKHFAQDIIANATTAKSAAAGEPTFIDSMNSICLLFVLKTRIDRSTAEDVCRRDLVCGAVCHELLRHQRRLAKVLEVLESLRGRQQHQGQICAEQEGPARVLPCPHRRDAQLPRKGSSHRVPPHVSPVQVED